MKKISLVIMAAGIGSRFKGGVKQLTPVGPNGELIIDYSIYDALQAGFNKVVFIIRKELEDMFRETVGSTWDGKIEIAYVHQELDDIPTGFEDKLAARTSPWGTGQAILCCKDAINEPFAVINADDYYGATAFKVAYEKLTQEKAVGDKLDISMVGFILKNTLSDNGTVTRGVCDVDENNNLIDVHETYKLERKGDKAVGVWRGQSVEIDLDNLVSMNMWCFYPEIFDILEEGFTEFLEKFEPDVSEKQEYLLPSIVGRLLREGKTHVNVLQSPDKWFGVTYIEDKDIVIRSIKELIEAGVYPKRLV